MLKILIFNSKFIWIVIEFANLKFLAMSRLKHLILQMDFFSHSSFQRYKQQQSYRTLIGGITSVILVILFITTFASLTINTFNKTIIISVTATNYDDDPSYTEIPTNPANSYMFAIGLTGIDLSSSLRYFDIVMSLSSSTQISGTTTKKKVTTTIPLAPCTIDQWSGISDSLTNAFTTLNLTQWLCPPTGQVIPLQGKYTSASFKYGSIYVNACTNNTLFPNTTCRDPSEITSYLNAQGQFVFNFYFINPVINPGQEIFRQYYLEDSNYFSFDTLTGISSNLYFGDYDVTTDTTFFPWKEETTTSGFQVQQTAMTQLYQIQSGGTQYLKFYLRKAASKMSYDRSFQKLDQTFSYIGGLFGTIVLILIFLSLYSKYSYELSIGDKIFKERNNGTFGAQNFNFVVFLGYLIFNSMSKFGILLNWKSMRTYHRCRQQCQKQLNIDLLFKKVTHFQQIASVLLEEHQLKMLLMAPKPTINEAKRNRKRYFVKTIIYHQLDSKGQGLHIEQAEFKDRMHQYLREHPIQNIDMLEEYNEATYVQKDFAKSYKKILKEHEGENPFSKKIVQRLNLDRITKGIIDFLKMREGNAQQVVSIMGENIVNEDEPPSADGLMHREQVTLSEVSNRLDLERGSFSGKSHITHKVPT